MYFFGYIVCTLYLLELQIFPLAMQECNYINTYNLTIHWLEVEQSQLLPGLIQVDHGVTYFRVQAEVQLNPEEFMIYFIL